MNLLSLFYGIIKNSSGEWEEFVGRADKDLKFDAIIRLGTQSSPEKLGQAKTAKGEIECCRIGKRECHCLTRLGVKNTLLNSLRQYTDAVKLLKGEYTVAQAEEALGVELRYVTPEEVEEIKAKKKEEQEGEKPLPEVVDSDSNHVFSSAIKAYIQKMHTPKHNGSTIWLEWHGNGRIGIRKDGVPRGFAFEKATEVDGKIYFDWELKST